LDHRSVAEKTEGTTVLKDLVTNSQERWLRFFAVQALSEMPKNPEVKSFFDAQLKDEEDNFVKAAMQRYVDKF
jgi:hypothetical protein